MSPKITVSADGQGLVSQARAVAGDDAPGVDGALIPVDTGGMIVIAHSDKGESDPTWEKTSGFHPRAAFAGRGAAVAGEAPAILLRPGNAGSNTASEHVLGRHDHHRGHAPGHPHDPGPGLGTGLWRWRPGPAVRVDR
jgi:hypothetical protein